MTGEKLRLVVDASVGINLFVNEPDSNAVHDLFAKLAGDPPAELFVPDLFYIECANILLKYIRRFGRSLADSKEDLADLNLLTLKTVPTADLMEEALILAHERKLTAYDACFAVLARQLAIPLLTADKQVTELVEWAVLLADFKLPGTS